MPETLKDLKAGHNLDRLRSALTHVTDFGCAIDVGAHRGIWTREMLGRFGRVVAIEPVEENFQFLPPESVNHLCAAGSREGGVRLVPGGISTGQWCIDGDGGVSLITIDSLSESPGFIKFDVEGYEQFAILGAKRTIKTHKPLVLIEENGLCKRYGVKEGQCGELLESWGMRFVENYGKDLLYSW